MDGCFCFFSTKSKLSCICPFLLLLCYCALFVPQVSMEVCHKISVEMTKTFSSPPPSPKKGKGKAQKTKAVSPGIKVFTWMTRTLLDCLTFHCWCSHSCTSLTLWQYLISLSNLQMINLILLSWIGNLHPTWRSGLSLNALNWQDSSLKPTPTSIASISTVFQNRSNCVFMSYIFENTKNKISVTSIMKIEIQYNIKNKHLRRYLANFHLVHNPTKPVATPVIQYCYLHIWWSQSAAIIILKKKMNGKTRPTCMQCKINYYYKSNIFFLASKVKYFYVCLPQTQSLYYLDLLQKELSALELDHLKLPVMHLIEVIALDLLERSQLSELYQLR